MSDVATKVAPTPTTVKPETAAPKAEKAEKQPKEPKVSTPRAEVVKGVWTMTRDYKPLKADALAEERKTQNVGTDKTHVSLSKAIRHAKRDLDGNAEHGKITIACTDKAVSDATAVVEKKAGQPAELTSRSDKAAK